MPKVIPKPLFQIFALSLLLLCVLLTGYWFITDSGLYQFFVEMLGRSALERATSFALALLVNLVGLLIFTLGLRPFVRDMPTLAAQLQKEIDFLKAPGSLAEKAATARDEELRQIPPRQLGFICFMLGITFSVLTVITLMLTAGDIYVFHLALGLLGLGLGGLGVLQMLFGRRFF